MSDLFDLIALILSDPKLQNSKAILEREYRDEPILRTAAQMTNCVPKQIQEMKKLEQSAYQYHFSYEQLFYQQGKLMEDYTDDFSNPVKFFSYYPTYRDMNDKQLRTYFSWRTKVRRGEITETSLSYVYVYIYELLNQIGVSSPEKGFQMLLTFQEQYQKIDTKICSYLSLWLHDYVIYYGLDKSLLSFKKQNAYEAAQTRLLHPEDNTEEALFTAIQEISSYHIGRSRFYKQYPEDVRTVSCRVFLALCHYFQKYRKKEFGEYLFGKKEAFYYSMFQTAVFYEQNKTRCCEYRINPIHIYRCEKGHWTCEKYYDNKNGNQKLGKFLKAIDTQMRTAYAFPYPLKSDNPPKYLLQIIDKEIKQFLAEKQKQTVPQIAFDLSQLQGIRQAADSTREKLLVEEDALPEESFAPLESPSVIKPDTPEQQTKESSYGLNETECQFLRCLLDETPYTALLKESGMMLSVLVDHINETLFDRFGDTVILLDGDTPELIEDYMDELKGMITL